MKPQPKAEAERWLAEARSELAFARVGGREGFYAQADEAIAQATQFVDQATALIR